MALTPSVWRTARVLANPKRLACLQAVLRSPETTVQDAAARAGLRPNVASLYLRHLQSRGLLAARRESRWVHYAAQSDDSVLHAGRILDGMRAALRTARPPFGGVRRILTGFTHPRRLKILAAIQLRGTADFDVLRVFTGISRPALTRHLDKLRRHGLVCDGDDGWRLAPRPRPLAAVLLRCLTP